MNRRTSPGEGESYEEYRGDDTPVLTGEFHGVAYEIYNINDSHYASYLQLPDVCRCMIETRCLPPVPVQEQINFGPTTDGWIGFSTIGASDHNYTGDWKPLPNDHRSEPDPMNYIEEDDIRKWTPRLFEEVVTDWIQTASSTLEEVELQCSH